MEKKISLYCRTGGSNKEYHLQLVPKEEGWVVNFQYGAIGKALKPGCKTAEPMPYDKALKIYEKIVREKLSEQYQPGETADDFDSSAVGMSKEIFFVPMLLDEVQSDDEVQYLIQDDEWMMEEKKDGERRALFAKRGEEAFGINKKRTKSSPS